MSHYRQNFRKSLAAKGLIFLAGEEMEITVRDISITGVFAELPANTRLPDIDAFFKAINPSAIIDIFLMELQLAGEAEVIRVELKKGIFFIGVEFRDISYDAEDIPYKRKVYRKIMSELGTIFIDGKRCNFCTKNVSVDGLMIRIPGKVAAKKGMVVKFDFSNLDLKGEIQVIWFEYDENGGTLMGLKYMHLEKAIEGFPRFAR